MTEAIHKDQPKQSEISTPKQTGSIAPLILAIETSCDDTAVAVVRGSEVLSNVITSQDIHNLYGGVVPELASREHMKAMAPVTHAALAHADVGIGDIDAIAVTTGPGLPGSLIVGTHFARGLAFKLQKPLIAINHIEAHMYSGYLEHPGLPFPSVCLVVSGGHTSLFYVESFTTYSVLGRTKDDAAGEAFDKVAKMLGLGYPGGPHIDRLAKEGNAATYNFPRGLMHEEGYDFSFSGLKTSVRYYIQRVKDEGGIINNADIAASVQRAIVDVLVSKTLKAADAVDAPAVCIAGGVSANSELRSTMLKRCAEANRMFVAPRTDYSVDNAAMIGFLAGRRLANVQELS
ncbi:MAG: tRNA (adenosine(37)-N6)-threonylcarbamoyltransferase complex transferase subunit TsaD [bacterium]|nr:tRNA (adenosine(37)-N6)-threonylcarbamoyltransferase complex transferase subunit TsaD [bacterium]